MHMYENAETVCGSVCAQSCLPRINCRSVLAIGNYVQTADIKKVRVRKI